MQVWTSLPPGSTYGAVRVAAQPISARFELVGVRLRGVQALVSGTPSRHACRPAPSGSTFASRRVGAAVHLLRRLPGQAAPAQPAAATPAGNHAVPCHSPLIEWHKNPSIRLKESRDTTSKITRAVQLRLGYLRSGRRIADQDVSRDRRGPPWKATERSREKGLDSPMSRCVSWQCGHDSAEPATLPAQVCLRFLRQAQRVHDAGRKSYGLIVAEPDAPGGPLRASDVIFLDSRHNRRNESGNRAAFEAQGDYFRSHDDAGFVADPNELLAVHRQIEASGHEIVAMFHSHRRQPANFSWIDFRLHNPAFAWHLIISFHSGRYPHLQPFRIHKDGTELGISADDNRQGSELAYPGPEVVPLCLVIDGTLAELNACAEALRLPTRAPSGPPESPLPAVQRR
jgi:proteasome lid subunit RPN8/RPN11